MNLAGLRLFCCCGRGEKGKTLANRTTTSPVLELDYRGYDRDQTETQPLNRRSSVPDHSLAAESLHNIPSIQTDFLSDFGVDDDEVFRHPQERNSSIFVELPTSTHNNSFGSGMELPIQAESLRKSCPEHLGDRGPGEDNCAAVAPRQQKRSVGQLLPSPIDNSEAKMQLNRIASLNFQLSPAMIQKNLYESPSDPDVVLFGQVHFSLQYDLQRGCLTVQLIEAKDLVRPGRDPGNYNPYVQVVLLPERKISHQTRVQQKTSSPVFQQSFVFQKPLEKLIDSTLRISVIDFNHNSRHCLLGHADLRLEEFDLISGGNYWRDVVCPKDESSIDLGQIQISLKYLPQAESLSLGILAASQLLQTHIADGSDPSAKVSLIKNGKLVKSKQTEIHRRTLDPQWNEMFQFRLSPEELQVSSLVVSVFGRNSKSRDDIIGRVVFGLHSTGARETQQWQKLMACPSETFTDWIPLQSLKEADITSAASRLSVS